MRFPEDYIGKVLHGDCLEIMNNMPDGCVDLVLRTRRMGSERVTRRIEQGGIKPWPQTTGVIPGTKGALNQNIYAR